MYLKKTVFLSSLFTLFLLSTIAFSQTLLPNDRSVRSQSIPSASPNVPKFKEAESRESISPTVKDKNYKPMGIGDTFTLNKVLFEGNTLYSDEQLFEVVKPFIGKTLGMSDLEELRFRLSKYYSNAGFTTSGAVFPDQTIRDGVVKFTFIEGKLTEINIEGQERLKDSYITERLLLNSGEYFNSNTLQKNYQTLLSDPLIERLNGNIRPGTELGEAILDLKVKRARPYDSYVLFDNHHAPTGGEYRGVLNGVVRNLTGYGDSLNMSITKAEGEIEGDFYFQVPINGNNTQVYISATKSDFEVVEKHLELAEIESEYTSYNVGISHPFYQKENFDLSLSVGFTNKQSQSFLFGEGTPFTPGVDSEGKAATNVLSFSQDLNLRGENQVLSLRSTFNLGFDILNATENSDAPDGQFFSWLGQAQYIQRLDDKGQQVSIKGNLQLAESNLLALEKISIGGPDSVRGYRSNYLIRDNGFDLSVEYHYPVFGNAQENKQINMSLAAFVDTGMAWNNNAYGSKDNITSAGLGVIVKSAGWYSELYWAHKFDTVPNYNKKYLQDEGITFRVMKFF